MSLLASNPENKPLHVLFPWAYKASARMIVRDFAVIGGAIVALVVTLAALF